MKFLSERHIANPVVLSGDIHAFVVSGLHLKPADLDSPVVATEFVATSVSSDARPEDYFENIRKLNPNLLTATGLHRGYIKLDITKERLRADLVALDTVKTPDSGRKHTGFLRRGSGQADTSSGLTDPLEDVLAVAPSGCARRAQWWTSPE